MVGIVLKGWNKNLFPKRCVDAEAVGLTYYRLPKEEERETRNNGFSEKAFV
jgi:hypothetical protein